MEAYLATHEQFESWLVCLAQKTRLYYPGRTGEVNFNFEPVSGPADLEYEGYRPTIVPPFKTLFTDGQVLFRYTRDSDGHYRFFSDPAPEAQILAGIRACDLKAIHLMDQVLADGTPDTPYLQRRQATSIIAFNCLSPCDAQCFCETAGALDFQQGADIFATPLGQQWLLEVQTSTGLKMLETADFERSENATALKQAALEARPRPFGRQFQVSVAELPGILAANPANQVYQKYADRCFSCGTCNLVCPTCYCFEVSDDFELDGHSGKRTRHWDACLSPGFAEVAGGHNFRQQVADRQRHRVRRKFEFLTRDYDTAFCTGCGRCGRQCTTGIDIFDIVNEVAASIAETGQQTV